MIMSGMMMGGMACPFREGDVVVLIQSRNFPSPQHPVWDHYQVKGIVAAVHPAGTAIYVKWENGERESYELSNHKFKLYAEIEKEGGQEETTKKRPTSFDFSPLEKLVIDKAAKEEITSVLKQHSNQQKIFSEWGLGDVIEYGRGMTFLFYGPPGTGKTWGAKCIAKVMGKDLITVGAAEIQTSEPGGANRNIQNAFASAKSSGKALFFDECDSLITQRENVGMVLGSEINTLLTEIEKFEGVCILATNRIDSLDEALERRISLILEFPEPNFALRTEIWNKMLPKKMPLDADVKVETLAEYKLTGGQIKNVVLHAARQAAANGEKKVGKKYFEAAVKRLQESKSLMGTASRYRQAKIREDYTKGAAV